MSCSPWHALRNVDPFPVPFLGSDIEITLCLLWLEQRLFDENGQLLQFFNRSDNNLQMRDPKRSLAHP
jgi:hypothetical protein